MDLFNVLTYLNKISLVAFFITAIVLIYQVVIMKRGNIKKKSTPVIPNFNEKMAVPVKNFTSINEEKLVHKTQPMPKNILFPIIGITVICLVVVVYLINKQNKQIEVNNFNNNSANEIVPTLIVKKNIYPTAIKPSVLPTSITIPTVVVPSILPTVITISPTVSILSISHTTITTSPAVTIFSISPSPTSIIIPTRIPTTSNNETVIAYITPTGQLVKDTVAISSTILPTKTSSLPLTGTVENGLVIAAVSGFMIILAFVF